MNEFYLYFDGLCEPRNPGGIACYGWFLEWDSQVMISEYGEVARGSGATNNVAEYSALIEGLKFLATMDLKCKVIIRGDSMLVIKQLSGDWKVKSSRIFPLFKQAFDLLNQLEKEKGYIFHLQWVPREKNSRADRLSREAYREAII